MLDGFDKIVLNMATMPRSRDDDSLVFYMIFLQMFKREETEQVETAGVKMVGSNIYLMYNPKFLFNLPVKEQIAIIQHEIEHVVFLHPLRYEKYKNINFELWNIATDIAINQNIPNIPSWALTPEVFKFPKDLSAEEYMELLLKKSKGWGGGGGGNDNEKDKEDQNKNDEGGTDHQKGKKLIDSHDYWKTFQEQNPEVSKTIIKEVVKYVVEKSCSKIPEHLKKPIDALLTPEEIPWYDKLKKLLGNHVKAEISKYTWKKPNRRGLITQGRTYRRKAPFALVLDTSGSMSDEDIITCCKQLLGVVKKYKGKLLILFHTTKVYQCQWIKSVEDLRKMLNAKTSGGTDYRDVLTQIVAKKLPVNTIVWATDLVCDFPPKPNYNIIWVVPPSVDKPSAPYGEIVQINSPEK